MGDLEQDERSGMLFHGIDNGGTVTKAALFDARGKEIAVAFKRIPTYSSKMNWVERDLNQVWEINVQVIKEVIEKSEVKPETISGIGVTGYGNGICLINDKGCPIYPAIVSNDNRAESLCEYLVEEGIEDIVYPLTGQTFWLAQTAVLAVWMKAHRPEILKRTSKILSIKDFIRMKLTGNYCYEITEGTCNGLMNVHNNCFDPKIFDALGIPECMDMMPEYVDVLGCSG